MPCRILKSFVIPVYTSFTVTPTQARIDTQVVRFTTKERRVVFPVLRGVNVVSKNRWGSPVYFLLIHSLSLFFRSFRITKPMDL
jgi:hypothetical protein